MDVTTSPDVPPDGRTGSRRGPVVPYLVCALGAVAVSAAHLLTDPDAHRGLLAVGYLGVQLTGLVTCARAAWHPALGPAERRPWRYLTAAFVVLLGYGVAMGAAFPGDGQYVVSPALLVALGCRVIYGPLLLAGLVHFAADPLAPRARWRLLLDVATVVGGGLMLLWYFVVGPALADSDAATTVVSTVLPATDLVLLVGVCAVLIRGAVPTARRPLLLMLVGVTAYLAADVRTTYYAVNYERYDTALWMELLVLLAMIIMTIAAAEQLRLAGRAGSAVEAARPLRPHSSLPYLALVIGYGVLVAAAVRAGTFPWIGLVAGALVMTFAVAGRQVLALRDNHELVVTDGLTGLANRLRLRESLTRAAERTRRSGRMTACLLLDLDGFKEINDTLGHEAGDAVLVAFARALETSVRAGDTVARLGGDEFAIVLDGVDRVEDAVAVADRILAATREPLRLGGRDVHMRTSIGIAVSRFALGVDSATERELVHQADLAMYAAKNRRTHGWHLFDSDGAMTAPESVELSAELVDGLPTDRLRVLYQPVVTLPSGAVIGVEALVRWQHPTRGLLPPEAFLPLVAASATIAELDAWVLEHAAADFVRWRRRLPAGRPLWLSVNVAAVELARDGYPAAVLDRLARAGMAPGDLVLEVVEGELTADSAAAAALRELRAHGVRVALDHVGSGFVNLAQLAELPLDQLKLDRVFVSRLGDGSAASTVAAAVVRLGQALHLDTGAVGVERDSQAAELVVLGCGAAQGNHFGAPMPADGIDAVINRLAPVGSGWSADRSPAGG